MKKVSIRNAAETETKEPEILLYGDVGYEWDGFKAADVAEALKTCGQVPALTVRLNSMGGDVGEGLAIYNLLRSHGATITTRNDGYALSSGATIFMAGDKRVMGAGSVLMIHKPSCFAYGDAEMLRKQAGVLDVLQTQIASIYAATSGKSIDLMNQLMDAETWLTGEEATETGLATEAIAADGPAGPDGDEEGDDEYGNLALARFRNAPARLRKAKRGNRDNRVDAWRREMAQRWLRLHEMAQS